MRRHLLILILATMLAAGSVVSATAQVPKGSQRDAATPEVTTGDPGCELIDGYVRSLFTIIDDSGAFADFFFSDAEWGDVSAEFAGDVRADGDEMLADLRALDVPGAYAEGHEGILAFFELQIEFAHFYGIDTSVVPDLNAQTDAFTGIDAGEIAIAEACPDEIDEVGGYILLPPAEDLTDPDPNPDNIPE